MVYPVRDWGAHTPKVFNGNFNLYNNNLTQGLSTGDEPDHSMVTGITTVPDSTPTGLVSMTVAANHGVGGLLDYFIIVNDANRTLFQAHEGGLGFVAINNNGTLATDVKEVYVPATDVTVVNGGGSLSDVFTISTNGATATINANINSSIASPVIEVHWRLTLHHEATVTVL